MASSKISSGGVFQQRARNRDALPLFVRYEFDAFLECGILAHGLLRLHCGDSGHDKLVAFSCKRSGFCPSCGARRMAQSAAYLVDHVIAQRHLLGLAEHKPGQADSGAVTLIQRFGSAANLNIHLYCLMLDGVY